MSLSQLRAQQVQPARRNQVRCEMLLRRAPDAPKARLKNHLSPSRRISRARRAKRLKKRKKRLTRKRTTKKRRRNAPPNPKLGNRLLSHQHRVLRLRRAQPRHAGRAPLAPRALRNSQLSSQCLHSQRSRSMTTIRPSGKLSLPLQRKTMATPVQQIQHQQDRRHRKPARAHLNQAHQKARQPVGLRRAVGLRRRQRPSQSPLNGPFQVLRRYNNC